MSDLNLVNMLTENWSSYPLVLSVMFASFVGSSHCVAMCGPVTILLKKNNGNIHLYNLGRLITYLFLGFIAGTIGKEFLNSHYSLVSLISTILISGVVISLGLNLVFRKNAGLHMPNAYSFLFSNALKWIFGINTYIRSLILGMINGFIPCGWLYVFVIASITLKSSIMGALLMFFFWVGTVPALTFLSIVSNRIFKILPANYIRIAGVLLIMAGLFTLLNSFIPGDDIHDHGHKISMIENTELWGD